MTVVQVRLCQVFLTHYIKTSVLLQLYWFINTFDMVNMFNIVFQIKM